MILWDDMARKVILQKNVYNGRIRGIAFSPDGQKLAAAARSVSIFGLPTGDSILDLGNATAAAGYVAFSGDGKRLAMRLDDNKTILVWDAGSGTLQHTFNNERSAFAWDADSRSIFVEEHGWIGRWNVEDGTRSRVTPAGRNWGLDSLRLGADGRYLAAAGVGFLRVWDLHADKPEVVFDRGGEHFDSANTDGRTVVGTTWGNEVLAFDLASGRQLCRIRGTWGLSLSPDGAHVAARQGGAVAIYPARLRMDCLSIDPQGMAALSDCPPAAGMFAGMGDAVYETARGGKVLSIGGELSRDGRFLSRVVGRTLQIYDAASGSLLRRVELWGAQSRTIPFAVNADATLVAKRSSGGITILGIDNGDMVRRLEEKNWCEQLLFSPQNDLLAACGGGTARIWQWRAGRLCANLPSPGLPSSMAFSHDGRSLAISS